MGSSPIYTLPERVVFREWGAPPGKFRVRNGGRASVASITISKPRDAAFSLRGPDSFALEAGEAKLFSVEFHPPPSTGAIQDQLTVRVGGKLACTVELQALERSGSSHHTAQQQQSGGARSSSMSQPQQPPPPQRRPNSGRASRAAAAATVMAGRAPAIMLHPERRDLFFMDGVWYTARGEEWAPPSAASPRISYTAEDGTVHLGTRSSIGSAGTFGGSGGDDGDGGGGDGRHHSTREAAGAAAAVAAGQQQQQQSPPLTPRVHHHETGVVTTFGGDGVGADSFAGGAGPPSTDACPEVALFPDGRQQGGAPDWIMKMIDQDAASNHSRGGGAKGAHDTAAAAGAAALVPGPDSPARSDGGASTLRADSPPRYQQDSEDDEDEAALESVLGGGSSSGGGGGLSAGPRRAQPARQALPRGYQEKTQEQMEHEHESNWDSIEGL
jgi:hypothetical protein